MFPFSVHYEYHAAWIFNLGYMFVSLGSGTMFISNLRSFYKCSDMIYRHRCKCFDMLYVLYPACMFEKFYSLLVTP